MDKLKLFPKLLADPIQEYNKSKTHLYIFNSKNNRGYKLDGLAANLCFRFDGKKSLEQVIKEFEVEMELQPNSFSSDIESLLVDLQNNSLLEYLELPQLLKES
jgi:hypothetical protein